jgi:hypothetical protein
MTPAAPPLARVTGAAVAKVIGQEREQSGAVYEITIGRPDIDLRARREDQRADGPEHVGAFARSDADARVAGDVAMRESEIQPVLNALRSHGINIVPSHQHMTGVTPTVIASTITAPDPPPH